MSISVAMATYNGEAFLEEQLRSLVQQSRLPLELVVRDDASSDCTLSILEAFSAKAPFPVRILPAGPRLGYADNFLAAAAACSGDYIAFCDQDDVWLQGKLAAVTETISAAGNPALVMHSATDVDEHLQPLATQANLHRPQRSGRLGADPLMVVRGFLMTVRRDVFSLMANTARPHTTGSYTEYVAHDVWAYHCGNILGPVVILPDRLALYRRHRSNVTTLRPKSRSTGPLDRIRQIDLEFLARHIRFFIEVAEAAPDAGARSTYGIYASILQARMDLYDFRSTLPQRVSRLSALIRACAANRSGKIMPMLTLVKDVLFSLVGPDRRSGSALRGPEKLAPLGEQDERQRG